jgi:hypothetical protein
MADSLHLSLWYPNLRFDSLGAIIARVLASVARHGGSTNIYAVTVYPVRWSEPPVFQHIYGDGDHAAPLPLALTEALEMLHEDFAYEFQVRWELWEPESAGGLDPIWRREPRLVSVIAFGPDFEEGAYEQEGHIRVDFGTDSAFLIEETDLNAETALRIRENVQQLVDLTAAIEKDSGASGRLLWSESGENLAQKLLERLQRVN